MGVRKDQITQDYYTTQELKKASWFPIDSPHTIYDHINNNELGAVNVSTKEDKKRWRIPRDAVIEFLEGRSNI